MPRPSFHHNFTPRTYISSSLRYRVTLVADKNHLGVVPRVGLDLGAPGRSKQAQHGTARHGKQHDKAANRVFPHGVCEKRRREASSNRAIGEDDDDDDERQDSGVKTLRAVSHKKACGRHGQSRHVAWHSVGRGEGDKTGGGCQEKCSQYRAAWPAMWHGTV
ncbi:hypothetical protein RRG08_061337 [Elysia crispata]|uniref:Uncharacterized protein n=1 Tax=Elysia crispata TaxID=231223 RepID=A0AAE1AGE1_9GAST|nr:hypothetical protein RRG08_061337 [Elysia crispata]